MLILNYRASTTIPVEAECITPQTLAGKSLAEIASLPVQHGNTQVALGEFFNVEGDASDGEVLIDPVTLTRLLAQVAREREEKRDAQNLLNDLTEREREILQLLAEGMRNDDIASKLFISPQTVQTHVRNILGKLRVHSKLEAVSFAVKHGAITV